MFQAKDRHGELQSLYHLSLNELSLMKNEDFYCPVCNELLHIRSGARVTPHFAHFPKSCCELMHSGESIQHEQGKWLLYRWLMSQQYDVQLEYYLPKIKQRADVLLTYKTRRLAIEFQCSTISVREIKRRTGAYISQGIFPLWILGINQLQQAGYRQFSLTEFHRQFLYYFNTHYQLYFLDLSSRKFVTLACIKGMKKQKVYAELQHSSLEQLTFPQLFSTPASSLYPFLNSWEKLMYDYRTRYQAHVSSEERQFRQYLYLKGYHFSLIPSVCYIPLPSQVSLPSSPFIWQTRLIVDQFIEKPIGAAINFPIIKGRGTINDFRSNLTTEYLAALELLGVVERTGNHTWVKLKNVVFHKHMIDAIKEDKETMDIMKKLTKN